MKNTFILGFTMLARKTSKSLVVSWTLADDAAKWCDESFENWQYERVMVECKSALSTSHARHLLIVEDEDDAMLFKLRWMGFRDSAGADKVLGPFTAEKARTAFNTWELFTPAMMTGD